MLDIQEHVRGWLAEGQQVALATVVKTWGSAPRRAGAKLAFTTAEQITGSVSGGCIEGAVIDSGLTCLTEQRPQLLHFGVADDSAWEVGLTCGGEISVFVEPLDAQWWGHASRMVDKDSPFTTITILDSERAGAKILFNADWMALYSKGDISADDVSPILQTATQNPNTQMVTHDETRFLIDRYTTPPHLILIGGAHVAIPLAQMAQIAGFRVSIVDPRSAFATPERFPDVYRILHSYPHKALPELGLTDNTYIAVLTHDPKIDDKALITALPSAVPYIGVLSSRRTHQQRIERLQAAGISDDLIARIHTPIGLDIAGQVPQDIAVAILAQIVAVRNGKA